MFSVCLMTLCAVAAHGSVSTPPSEFGGISLGSSLGELKQRYPEVRRNPDSDREFQVYQTLNLKGVEPKSAAAFDVYRGRVVGGQIMLDSYNTRYWWDRMVKQYGKPDSCSYCEDPELVSANWMWGNGIRLHIGGSMLTLLTEEGASQRHEWIARGDNSPSADSGDEDSDLGEVAHPVSRKMVAKKKKATPTPAVASRPPTKWDNYYQNAKSRFARLMGWSK